MEAMFRIALLGTALTSMGASYKTENFIVNAPSAQLAEQVGVAAEHYRKTLSIEWLGQEMPPWSRPCPIAVNVGAMGAGGSTTFSFDRGEVSGWRMELRGTEERILDSVLPHEVNHTIFACHFRRPLPRWADEGAASMIEHDSERMRLRQLCDEVQSSSRRIPLGTLLAMKEYPKDNRTTLTLYAQGYSLVDYLLQLGDRPKYLRFIQTAHEKGWDASFEQHYGFRKLDELDRQWSSWVVAGSPRLVDRNGRMVAASDGTPIRTAPRGQNPDSTDSAPRIARPSQATAPAETQLASGSNRNLSRQLLTKPILTRNE